MRPNLGDVLADKYRLDRVLGEGGMSMVFAATNVLTGKQVAIKWLQPEVVRDDEQSKRLLREAQATSAIDHPNVVNLFDVERDGESMFLVMELLHGEPLSMLLARGPHDPCEFVRLMMPVLRGVHAAHRMGIVHRDLKPDNIFMCRDPHGEPREPKVLDFGISKLADSALAVDSQLTREGTVFGTPQYMAPEQMRDARIADPRSDVYALGVIFYRALADQYPYDADTLTALAIRIVEGDAVPLHELCPHVDVGLSDVVMRALALDPEHRYQTVAALGSALEPYAEGVLFSPGAERDSAPALLRRSFAELRASTPSARHSQPPPPPPALRATQSLRNSQSPLNSQALRISRTGSRGDGAQAQRLAEDRQDRDHGQPLLNSQALPVTRPSLRIPPPPPPSSRPLALPQVQAPSVAAPELDEEEVQRQSRPDPVPARPSSLDVPLAATEVTQRIVARASTRRRTLLVGAALFTLGSVAPVGWQMLSTATGAGKRTATVVSQQQPSTRFAMGRTTQQPREEAAAAVAPSSAPVVATPLAPALREAPSEAEVIADELPLGLEAPAEIGSEEDMIEEPRDTTEHTLRTPTARSLARKARAEASKAAASAVPSSPTPPSAVEPTTADTDTVRDAPAVQTERNPYLR